jgi:hypothetical protein
MRGMISILSLIANGPRCLIGSRLARNINKPKREGLHTRERSSGARLSGRKKPKLGTLSATRFVTALSCESRASAARTPSQKRIMMITRNRWRSSGYATSTTENVTRN